MISSILSVAILAVGIQGAIAAPTQTGSDYKVYSSTYEIHLFEAGLSTYGYRTPAKPIAVDGKPQLFGEPQLVDGHERLFYQRISVVREDGNNKVAISLKAFFDPNQGLVGFRLLRFNIPVALGYPLTALNQVDYRVVESLKDGDVGQVQIMKIGEISLMRSEATMRALIVPKANRQGSTPQISPKRMGKTLQQLDDTSKQLQKQ